MAPCAQTQIAARAARPAAGASEQRTYTTPHRTRVDQDTSIISSPDVLASVGLRTRFNAGPARLTRRLQVPIGTSMGDGMHARARRRRRQSEAAQGCGQCLRLRGAGMVARWGHGACEERVVARGRTAEHVAAGRLRSVKVSNLQGDKAARPADWGGQSRARLRSRSRSLRLSSVAA